MLVYWISHRKLFSAESCKVVCALCNKHKISKFRKNCSCFQTNNFKFKIVTSNRINMCNLINWLPQKIWWSFFWNTFVSIAWFSDYLIDLSSLQTFLDSRSFLYTKSERIHIRQGRLKTRFSLRIRWSFSYRNKIRPPF